MNSKSKGSIEANDLSSINQRFSKDRSDLPSLKRGRQLFSSRKPIVLNELTNISNYSTCETKHILSRQFNFKPKHKSNKKKRNVSSSSSSFENNSSDSDSISSAEMRKKRFLEEDNSFTYPTRKEVGLFSSEEDSSEMESPLKENLENEIERNLIEIYNKNISNCKYNSKDHCDRCDRMNNYRRKRNKGLSSGKKELKLTFKQLNEQDNLFALQVLSKKIKELINKYKEKIIEIPEISVIYSKYKSKNKEQTKTSNDTKELINPFSLSSFYKNTSLFKQASPCLIKKNINLSTTSNQGGLIITPQAKLSNIIIQNEITERITNILLKELINIKHTLKRSSYEIQQIFQYPLSILKRKYSIEKIQLEVYHNILLNDELLSTLLLQIKLLFTKKSSHNEPELLKIIEDDRSYSYHEMTNFDKEINQSLGIHGDLFDNNSNEDFLDSTAKLNANSIIANLKKNTTTPTSSSSIEYQSNANDLLNRFDSDIDIDDLIKYIDSDEGSVSSKTKKKKKKKKNKRKSNNASVNSIEEDKEIERYKEEINKCSVKAYEFCKIRPHFSKDWLSKLK